jgi:Uma2 family endonuclease
MSSTATQLVTAQEFFRRPGPIDGQREELVRGEVITMPSPGLRHGEVAMRVGFRLMTFLEHKDIGRVVTESGVRTEHDPDTVRGPDVSFWSYEKVPIEVEIVGYPEVPADLCIEVRSPSNTVRELREKTAEYLRAGVRLVWIVDPEDRSVTVYRRPGRGVTLSDDEVLDGEDVIPGFACPVTKLFSK